MDRRLSELLDESVARGVISLGQRNTILELAGEGTDGPRGATGEFLAWAREAPRGFNAISIAYGVGALAVVFALVWFLADRWNVLGASGVLAVALVYAAVFAVAARIFARANFPTALGVAMLLVVATVPLIVWSALRAAGVWVDDDRRVCVFGDAPFWNCDGHSVVLAAATFAAALGAMRLVRFGPLMIPGAAALAVILTQVALDVSRGADGPNLTGWSFTFGASVLAAMGYEVDRRRGHEDYGRWMHLAAGVCASIALVDLFATEHALRHLLLPTAIAAMVASLFLRRIVWLVVGLGSLFSYLTWLASDVFRRAVAFPVILAVVGVSVILVTVWVQRTYPRIAARVRAADGEVARFPGGAALLLAPALVAVLMMPAARDEARWERVLNRANLRRERIARPRRTPPRPPAVRPVAPTPPPDSGATRDSSHTDRNITAPRAY